MFTPRWRRIAVPAVFFSLLVGVFSLPVRGQLTETPQTVEPGKFLVEMDALSFDRERTGDAKFTALGLATTTISAGLTRSVDLQLGFQFFARTTYEDRSLRDTHTGIGDLTFRTKWTFWREESMSAAAAVIPYIKIPSNTGGVGNGSVEGGLILPWAMTLPGGIQTGAMFQWDVLRNASGNGYDSQWLASAYAHRSFTKLLGFYAEATAFVSSDNASSFAGTMGGGVTLTVSERVMWDYEISRGVGGRASDWKHVVRLTWGF